MQHSGKRYILKNCIVLSQYIVGFFVSSRFSFTVLEDLSLFQEGIIESIFIEIEFSKNNKVIFGNVYHPPNLNVDKNESFLNKMQTILDLIEQKSSKCIITGDFNLCLLKHDSFRPTSEFIDTMYSFGYLHTRNAY